MRNTLTDGTTNGYIKVNIFMSNTNYAKTLSNVNESLIFTIKMSTSTAASGLLSDQFGSSSSSLSPSIISLSTKQIFNIGNIAMFFIGIVTNVLNLIILNRKSMKSTTNKYLTALALCDLFVLLFSHLILSNSFLSDFSDSFSVSSSPSQFDSIPMSGNLSDSPSNYTEEALSSSLFISNSIPQTSFIITLYNKWSLSIYPRIYPYIYPFAIMFQIGTVLINLSMSIDRFIAIHFPLKSLKFCTISNAKKTIAAIFLFSLAYSSPRFFKSLF
jgi:hypothetical protein